MHNDRVPIQLVRWPERRFVAVVFSDPPGKLRMLFDYEGKLLVMCWLEIGNDGSLYLNPRQDGTDPPLHAQGVTDGIGGFATVESVELDEAKIQDRKLSYHASGWVKGGSKMTQSVQLRDVVKSTLIRQDDYAHPSRFQVVERSAMRASDLIVPGQDGQPYRLEEGHPLTSRLFVAPLRGGDADVVVIEDDPDTKAGQTAVVLAAINLEDCQDLTYQIQFFNRSGDWPDMSTIAFLNQARDGLQEKL
jgi:hypothetical protein